MGWSFRRSKRIGPFLFTMTHRGPTISVGGGGFRYHLFPGTKSRQKPKQQSASYVQQQTVASPQFVAAPNPTPRPTIQPRMVARQSFTSGQTAAQVRSRNSAYVPLAKPIDGLMLKLIVGAIVFISGIIAVVYRHASATYDAPTTIEQTIDTTPSASSLLEPETQTTSTVIDTASLIQPPPVKSESPAATVTTPSTNSYNSFAPSSNTYETNRTPNRTYTPSYSSGSGSVHVRGYYRKDGTYVRPHTRRSR